MGTKTNALEEEKQLIVESFSTKTFSDTVNSDGAYVLTGHKNVNAVTTVIESSNTISTTSEMVEDYYDVNGNYINTIVNIQKFENNFITGKAVGGEVKEVLIAPAAINEELEGLSNELVTQSEFKLKNDVESNVKSVVRGVGNLELKEVPGFTHKNIKEIKDSIEEMKLKYTLEIDPSAPSGEKIKFVEKKSLTPSAFLSSSALAAGAFDNYYRHDLTTTEFRVQALSAIGHQYIRLEGQTLGSTLNANSLITFKGYIDDFEEEIIARMQYNNQGLVFDWFFAIAGLVTLVVGWGTGPPGWIAIVGGYVGAFATFRTLTSVSYATQQRLSMSRVATQHQQSARYMLFTFGNRFENVNFTVVTGY